MVCSPGVGIIEPYSDGVTDFAVSSIVHQVQENPTRIQCQPGNGEILEIEPSLSVKPEIENLHIACHNNQTRLEWQHRGEVDHFEVDAGDGIWQTVSDQHFSFSSRFSTEQVLKVRAVSAYGAGFEKEINTDFRVLYYKRLHPDLGIYLPAYVQTSCSDMYFYADLDSPYQRLSFVIMINDATYLREVNQTLETRVDVPYSGQEEHSLKSLCFLGL